jgi:hypothetical protein
MMLARCRRVALTGRLDSCTAFSSFRIMAASESPQLQVLDSNYFWIFFHFFLQFPAVYCFSLSSFDKLINYINHFFYDSLSLSHCIILIISILFLFFIFFIIVFTAPPPPPAARRSAQCVPHPGPSRRRDTHALSCAPLLARHGRPRMRRSFKFSPIWNL